LMQAAPEPEPEPEPAQPEPEPEQERERARAQGHQSTSPAPEPRPWSAVRPVQAARVLSCAAKEWGARALELGLSPEAVDTIDVRKVLKHANPHHDATLKPMTGLDVAVVEFIVQAAGPELFDSLVSQAVDVVRAGRSVCIVCVGGKHRSVAVAEQAASLVGLRAEHLMLAV
jgi:hypothetical protein